jgi:hypothetical protein
MLEMEVVMASNLHMIVQVSRHTMKVVMLLNFVDYVKKMGVVNA